MFGWRVWIVRLRGAPTSPVRDVIEADHVTMVPTPMVPTTVHELPMLAATMAQIAQAVTKK